MIHESRILWIALVLFAIVAGAGLAVAQSKEATVNVPPERQYDTGHCYEYEAKMLYAATDINDPMQEQYLKAAQAYHQLDAIGQKCN